MYLNHMEITELINAGHITNVDPDCINAASLDVRLGETILMEKLSRRPPVIDYRRRDKLNMVEHTLDEGGFILRPGEVFLGHTQEKFNIPDNIGALFRTKSSAGRIFLEHMDSGWGDPGFYGALTLEFKNMNQQHSILLRPGDRVGQLVFMRGNPVPADLSYRVRGNYNGADGVKQVGFKGEAA